MQHSMIWGHAFSETTAPAGGGVLRRPQDTTQRRYETLRAYFLEGLTAAQAAARFGDAESSVQAMVRDFHAGDRGFFTQRRPGPRVAPAKQAARDQVLRLRQAGHSITEITQALATTATPLNRTGTGSCSATRGSSGCPPAPPASAAARAATTHPAPAASPGQPSRCGYAGVLLLVPGLVALDLPGAVSAARLPGTREVPALCSVLSLLALKAIGRRRVSHVDELATDPALATFAGLESLPKATALGTYSYRLARRHHERLLAASARRCCAPGRQVGPSLTWTSTRSCTTATTWPWRPTTCPAAASAPRAC